MVAEASHESGGVNYPSDVYVADVNSRHAPALSGTFDFVLGFGHPLRVGLVGLAAASFTSANGVHNAGITWGSGDTIRGANVDGSGRHIVFPHGYDEEGDPAWTRDGRGLAFIARLSDTVQIFVTWPGTRKGGVLGSGSSRSREPTWSPDAKRIAVSEEWGGFGLSNPEATIRIVSVATNTWTSVTRPSRHRIDADPAWAPDGRTIAFARQHDGGTPTLFLVRPRRKRILRGLRSPLVRWSPDGRKLLYTSGSAFRATSGPLTSTGRAGGASFTASPATASHGARLRDEGSPVRTPRGG